MFFGLLFLLLFHQPVKALRDAQCGVGHGDDVAGAGHGGQVLPSGTERVQILHRVSLAQFGLDGDEKIRPDFRGRKEDGHRLNPKAALNGEPRAARHGGERLGDGAAQLKPAAGAGRRATTSYHATGDGEPRAALGESRAGNEQEEKNGFHSRVWCGR